MDYSKIYSKDYFDNYDYGSGVGEYHTAAPIVGALDGVAVELYRWCSPKTAMDVGCATGHLVRSLVGLGVDAYGMDVSDYAIGVARSTGPPGRYIVQSVTDGIPGHYDLITFIEVAEHLEEDDAVAAIRYICESAEWVYFSSTSIEERGEYHINMRPPKYWAGIFRENGFGLDISFRSFFIPWAMLFRRKMAKAGF